MICKKLSHLEMRHAAEEGCTSRQPHWREHNWEGKIGPGKRGGNSEVAVGSLIDGFVVGSVRNSMGDSCYSSTAERKK